MVANIKETNCIIWICPSKCSKRDAEIQQSMKEKPVTLSLEQQLVKVAASEQIIAVDTSNDIQLQWALQRRGLAFDQCSLIRHHEHEIWVQQLLAQLTHDAPPGFNKGAPAQVIRADRELFTIMAQDIQDSVQPNAAGELPMELSLKALRTDPRVTMHLLPLPKSASKTSEPSSTSAGTRAPPTQTMRPDKKKKASPKTKSACPSELKGYAQKDSNGLPICWAFNLKSRCQEEVKNGSDTKVSQLVSPNTAFLKEKLQNLKRQREECATAANGSLKGSTESWEPIEGTKGKKFDKLPITGLLFIEIFAGSARLSSALHEVGFETMAVDKSTARSTKHHIALYDVTEPSQLQELMTTIQEEAHRIVAIHLAPACGTASRARERKLPGLQKKGFKVPQPLRSEQQPAGLDGLSGLDKLKTELANQSYDATAELVKLALQLRNLVSVENPKNSLFWLYLAIRAIVSTHGCYTVFANCMHGGKRDKDTSWWASDDTYKSLQAECNGQHKHASWAPTKVGKHLKFPSADEAAYPMLLCKRLALILRDYALENGALQSQDLVEQLNVQHSTSHRWVLGMLPRGKAFKPLVSEFESYLSFLNPPDHDPDASDFLASCPKGAKVVHRRLSWGCLRVDEEGIESWCEQDGTCKKLDGVHQSFHQDVECQAELCSIGLPREPWDFVQRAVKVGHPRTIAVHLSAPVLDMLHAIFLDEPWKLLRDRAKFLQKWTNRCRELDAKEKALHSNMEPHLQEVLTGKRLLVLQEILNDLDCPDKSLVDDIIKGFVLCGWMPKSNVFPSHTKRPTQSVESAMKAARGVNQSIVKQVESVQDPELCQEVWRLTEEEISKGWVWRDSSCSPSKHLLAKFWIKAG
eukprot:Skav218022  [mRNA]  locus=scaffold2344:307023:309707:- [translate_table: standard]